MSAWKSHVILMVGANDGAEGSNDIPIDLPDNVPPEPPKEPQPTPSERLQQVQEAANWQAQHIEEMRQEIEEAKRAHDEHVRYWNLPNPNQSKGKAPERGRAGAPEPPPEPNWHCPLHECDDRWSVPQPPPKWRYDSPQPTSKGDDDAPWNGIKPMVIRPPLPFQGQHDDIERFIGDCFTYFETFAPFFQLHSQKVTFAASYFEGTTKDWWVQKHQEFWTAPGWDDQPWRFRYPSWGEFVGLIFMQFHNPTTEDIHERRMFDL
ncbi:uncharacterized protein ARMOST_16971 [Armillaria ostoyae]|uniref:Retrotransposon gag domain-containing protein n=1 Tax=Armillaria ostoyae TaxID=47428 RepID=A0A284RXP5_ARMOS|nr:uncharacterized protein ARMOST_16971 [Armillaria ostoyae]